MSAAAAAAAATTITRTRTKAQSIFYVICCAPFLSGVAYVMSVKWRLYKSQHRPITPIDNYYIKNMKGVSPLLQDNPGIRIEEHFLSPMEQFQLRLDADKLMNKYGYSCIPFYMKDTFIRHLNMYQNKTGIKVNAFKCSGRPITEELDETKWTEELKVQKKEHDKFEKFEYAYEANPPKIAPWDCGHSFDIRQLPPSFQNLIQKIKSQTSFSLGSVRDVTIDYRKHKYFRLFPHKYPMEDGSNLFMITLDSDVVITLVPPEKERHRRSEVKDQSYYSFTDGDIDILHKKGDLLCLSNQARMEMELSVRQGIEEKLDRLKKIRNQMRGSSSQKSEEISESKNIPNTTTTTTASAPKYQDFIDDRFKIVGNLDVLDSETDEYIICDWWGAKENLLPREKERIQIYITFSRPT